MNCTRPILVGLTLSLSVSSVFAAETIRFEGAYGTSKYRLAPDASWHYQFGSTYAQKIDLSGQTFQLGASWWPERGRMGATSLGLRLLYVDLGKYQLDNEFPFDEPAYFAAKEGKTAVPLEKGRFQGQGGAKGLTFGIAGEHKVWNLHPGGEVGLAALYTTFHTELSGGCSPKWACADGLIWTVYTGVSLRYDNWSLILRRYSNVRGSNAEVNPLYVTPTSGALKALYLGYSF